MICLSVVRILEVLCFVGSVVQKTENAKQRERRRVFIFRFVAGWE
jgi:hypothetical protein